MDKFDMDVYVRNKQPEKPLLAVCMKTTPRNSDYLKYFIVVKKGEYFTNNIFRGIGFWSKEIPILDVELTSSQQFLEDQTYEEVWIPYDNISYIKSLVYIKR